MAPANKKAVLKALRVALCDSIGSLSKKEIESTNENRALLEEFLQKVMVDVLSTRATSTDFINAKKALDSMVGNMEKCAVDLGEKLPSIVIDNLKAWDVKWNVEKDKSNRASKIDTQSQLSKRRRVDQAKHAQFQGATSSTGDASLPSSLRNSECSLTVGIPHDAIVYHERMGKGSFGECFTVSIKDISFFPEEIVYAAKKYKGLPKKRLKSFEKEIGIDLIHRGIVRSIGHTRSSPWVAIFPLYNGTCLGALMQALHYDKGTFKRVVKKIAGDGVVRDKGREPYISLEQRNRINGFCEQAPNLIHAMVQAMAFAHEMGVVHCDLHPLNIMLDFTRDCLPRIGIIDWGLALRLGFEKRKSSSFLEKTHVLRPWLAPELLDKENDEVYTKAVDTYALSWVIVQICTFCAEFSSEHKTGWESTLVASQCDHIKHIVKTGYMVKYGNRKTLEELNIELDRMQLDPSKCLRPLNEMMPAFY